VANSLYSVIFTTFRFVQSDFFTNKTGQVGLASFITISALSIESPKASLTTIVTVRCALPEVVVPSRGVNLLDVGTDGKTTFVITRSSSLL
jgi:hypothetical protein